MEDLYNEYVNNEKMVIEKDEVSNVFSRSRGSSRNEFTQSLEDVEQLLENLDLSEDIDIEGDTLKILVTLFKTIAETSVSGKKSEERLDRLEKMYENKIRELERKGEEQIREQIESVASRIDKIEGKKSSRGKGETTKEKGETTKGGEQKLETEKTVVEGGEMQVEASFPESIDVETSSSGASFDSKEQESKPKSKEDVKNKFEEKVQEKIAGEDEKSTTMEGEIKQIEKVDIDEELQDDREYSSKEELYDQEHKREKIDAPDYLKIPERMKEKREGFEEIDRYWLDRPYSYAVILFDSEQGDYRYIINEPELSEKLNFVLDNLKEDLRNRMLDEDISKEKTEKDIEKLKSETRKALESFETEVDREEFKTLWYYIRRDFIGYGKLDPLMNDNYIEDISCNGLNLPVFIYHKEYRDVITELEYEDENRLMDFVRKLAQAGDSQISTSESMQSVTLPDGSRAELNIGETSSKGPVYTIRKFQEIPFTPIDLIRTGTFSVNQMAYLWLAIQENSSLMFAGGTASGKTTSMNAVSMFIPPKNKIVSIEDTSELKLPHDNWVPLKTREEIKSNENTSNSIEEYELLRSALRHRPRYIIVGEIRGEEARVLFQAMNTGHTTYSTMHAESSEEALRRLRNDPISVPDNMLNALDIISIQTQEVKNKSSGSEKIRRNKEIVELTEVKGEKISGIHVFEWDPAEDRIKEKIDDSRLLQRIRKKKGWTQNKLVKDLSNRKKILQYMLDNEIRNVTHVARIIQRYMYSKETLLREIENDTLDITNLEDSPPMRGEEV